MEQEKRLHKDIVSIHAPSRERPDIIPALRQDFSFNPRSLTGATIEDKVRVMYAIGVSIHAPSRERRAPTESTMPVVLFQSTLPHGSDYNHTAKDAPEWEFQSTLPHGSDAVARHDYESSGEFQSTLPHGSDAFWPFNKIKEILVSIHAPSRERLLCFGWFPADVRFQSTLPHGSDFNSVLKSACRVGFNPRSLTGATCLKHCALIA